MVDWNKRYTETDSRLFGDQPNEYVREVLARSDFQPRTALCLADGDGRNSGWLAEQSLTVTAVDISSVATEQALAHDRARGVSVERIVADLADWQPPAGRQWDAVFILYLQCESDVRIRIFRDAVRALPDGGWIVAEGFSGGSGEVGRLGPKMPDLLYSLPALTKALDNCRIIEAFEGRTWLDEGTKHQGDAHVIRILAQRPVGGQTSSPAK